MKTETEWIIPEPLSVFDVRLDDHTVTTIRQHGNASGPRLVLSHGNGLAVDLYFPFWSLFADDYELIVYDIRNHGWNNAYGLSDHNIPTLIHDHDVILDTIDRVYGNKSTVGVFHSLSTIIPLLSFSRLYSALVLFDPPLCKPGASQVELHSAAEQMAKEDPASRTSVQDKRRVFRLSSLHSDLLAGRSRCAGTHGADHASTGGEREENTSFDARPTTRRN